jgi:hypothetical protein
MGFRWFRQDKPAVLEALRRGVRPLMATTMASGPWDELIALHLELGGPECIGLLLADALYADGPLIAWLAYAKGIDILTPLPPDRQMFADALGMAQRGLLAWTRHRYVRTIQGHKEARTVAVAAVGEPTSWDSFVEAARGYGVSDPSVWVALIRELAPEEQALKDGWALVSGRRFATATRRCRRSGPAGASRTTATAR